MVNFGSAKLEHAVIPRKVISIITNATTLQMRFYYNMCVRDNVYKNESILNDKNDVIRRTRQCAVFSKGLLC